MAPVKTDERGAHRFAEGLNWFWSEKRNRVLLLLAGLFLFAYFVPFASERVSAAVQESFLTLSEYAQQHALLCLVPAFSFLYSGPAINILAIVLTAKVLGVQLG